MSIIRQKQISSKSKSECGYSLIQMAIALLVIGILASAFLQVYSLYSQTQKVITTQDNISAITDKIQSYRQGFGSYPCPAPINVQRNNVNYGTATTYAAYLATPAGTCTNGICIENNTRTINGVPTTLRARVGSVPFRDLQLDEKTTFDGYGSRIWYAVTEDMCSTNTFDDKKGGINIINDLGESQINPASSAAFIVVSPGINKVGAYSKSGVQISACATSGDIQNCRDVSIAAQADATATYLAMFETNATKATTYDDIVQYFASSFNPLWRRVTATSEDIVNMTTQNVGIATDAPSSTLTIPQSSVDVTTGAIATTNAVSSGVEHGALRAEGKIQADTYCDNTDPTKCFQPKDLTGDPDAGTGGMKCPTGAGYPVGITSDGTNAKLDCKYDVGVFCPAGETLTGFTGNPRRPVCSLGASFTSCPAMTIPNPKDQGGNSCGGSISLPLAAHNSTQGRSYGACVNTNYKCNNGNWIISGGPWGTCVNSPWTANGQPCGAGYTGTYTYSGTSCNGTTANNWNLVCPPTCIPYSTNTTTACAPPQTGPGITTTTNYVCSLDGSTHTVLNTSVSGSCTCGLQDQNVFQQCPAGQIRSSASPALPTASPGWPGDMTYGKVGLQTVNTTTCTSTAPASYTSYCICDTADQYSTNLVTPPTCKVAKSSSRMVNGVSYEYKYDVLKATVNAATCTKNSPTLESAAQFDDTNYYWRQQAGSALANVSNKSGGYPDVDQGCACSTEAGQIGNCYKPDGNGGYNVFNCKCNP